jgi:hypothetical protein
MVFSSKQHLNISLIFIFCIAVVKEINISIWLSIYLVQLLLVGNMWRWFSSHPITRKLISTLPTIIMVCISLVVLDFNRSIDVVFDSYVVGIILVIYLFAVLRNIKMNLVFLKDPDLIKILQPHTNRQSAVASYIYLPLCAISEELVFRMFASFLWPSISEYIFYSTLLFLTSHYVNPWSKQFIDYETLFIRFLLGVVLAVIFIQFGLGYSIIFHMIFNFTSELYNVRQIFNSKIS